MQYHATRISDGSRRNITVIAGPADTTIGIWIMQWQEVIDGLHADRGVTADWSWPEKPRADYAGREVMMLGAECAGRCQGMMLVSWPYPSRIRDGASTLHVEYLEAAPWNRKEVAGTREYKGIGPCLLSAAHDLSEALGYEGRLTLVSLPDAEPTYRALGMKQLGFGDDDDADLAFFEFSPASARRFRGS